MTEFTNRTIRVIVVSVFWEETLEDVIQNTFWNWRSGCLGKWIHGVVYKYLNVQTEKVSSVYDLMFLMQILIYFYGYFNPQ